MQMQSQAFRSLQNNQVHMQEQHAKVLELLIPLLPLLQALPLHIDVARNAIMEKIHECKQTYTSSLQLHPHNTQGIVGSSSSTAGGLAHLPIVDLNPNKRRRIHSDSTEPPTAGSLGLLNSGIGTKITANLNPKPQGLAPSSPTLSSSSSMHNTPTGAPVTHRFRSQEFNDPSNLVSGQHQQLLAVGTRLLDQQRQPQYMSREFSTESCAVTGSEPIPRDMV